MTSVVVSLALLACLVTATVASAGTITIVVWLVTGEATDEACLPGKTTSHFDQREGGIERHCACTMLCSC